MKKKILFLTIGSYVGGMEIVTLHLIRRLKTEGHEVKCLVTGWNDGRFIKELEEGNTGHAGHTESGHNFRTATKSNFLLATQVHLDN